MARKKRIAKKQDVIWTIPDELWLTLEAIFSEFYPDAKAGRPRCCMRKLVEGIIFRMRTGVQWNQLPREFGSDTSKLIEVIIEAVVVDRPSMKTVP